jgi:SAM-dependent methyltransferase
LRAFYDSLAPFYPFLFPDWEASRTRQAAQLDAIIRSRWGSLRERVLDIAAGVGTQALGLAALGYPVIASDLSPTALRRAQTEARNLLVRLPVCVGDFTRLPFKTESASLVIAVDNALPHLLNDSAILAALRECYRCLRPGGGVLLTVRDYGPPPLSGTIERHPYGWRQIGGQAFYLWQEWTWDGPCYNLRILMSHTEFGPSEREFRGRYYAIPLPRLLQLCREAGFADLAHTADGFYQPVILGTRPRVA